MVGFRIDSKDDFQAIEKAKCVYDALYVYSNLKFIRGKFRNEMEKMDRKQRYEFVKKKMKERLP